jgi:hypothetical protein
MPWRRGTVDIASASRTRRPGFESRHGIRFLGKHSGAVVYKMTYVICIVCVLKGEIKALASKIFKMKQPTRQNENSMSTFLLAIDTGYLVHRDIGT